MAKTAAESIGKRKKETILLLVVAALGLIGLLALQFTEGDLSGESNRALVRAGAEAPKLAETAPRLRIRGSLIKTDENPEADKPFHFKMTDFAQGAAYELDLGDGTRKRFDEKGVIRHVYHRKGPFTVRLFAEFEGEVMALDSTVKVVGGRPERIEIIDGIDF
ncbi:MAG: hypothetical protein ACK4NS_01515 [Saprospiraceae bacterium]